MARAGGLSVQEPPLPPSQGRACGTGRVQPASREWCVRMLRPLRAPRRSPPRGPWREGAPQAPRSRRCACGSTVGTRRTPPSPTRGIPRAQSGATGTCARAPRTLASRQPCGALASDLPVPDPIVPCHNPVMGAKPAASPAPAPACGSHSWRTAPTANSMERAAGPPPRTRTTRAPPAAARCAPGCARPRAAGRAPAGPRPAPGLRPAPTPHAVRPSWEQPHGAASCSAPAA